MNNYTPNPRTFRLEGFAELETQLVQMGKMFRADLAARQTVVKAAKTAMQGVYTSAVANAPYDEKSTGPIHLRNTIRLDARIPNKNDYKSIHVSETDAAIAVVSAKRSAVSLSQEFGNATTPMKAFLRPALDRNAEEVVRILKTELAQVIPAYIAKMNKGKKK
jgi:HK97 gp10 family phage protein